MAAPEPDLEQSYTVERRPHDALDAAEAYLEGAGTVAPGLRGRMERFGDRLAVHHGRIRTTVTAREAPEGTRIDVHRAGEAPLEDTRRWVLALGLGGFVVAWALTFYNERAATALSPLVTLTLFFLGVVAILVVLFVADRSLERRSEALVLSLEEAMRRDPLTVLQREIDALEQSSALANGLIFYCAALLVEFLVFIIVLSDGVREGIDEAAALEALRFGFLIPIAPALLFAFLYWLVVNRAHKDRLALVERRLARRGKAVAQ